MECECVKEGDATVVKVIGRLDTNTTTKLEQQCLGLIDSGETFLIVDLSELAYISSAGLRIILTTMKKLKAKGGRFALCGLNPMIREVFTISGFDSFIPTFATLQDALKM